MLNNIPASEFLLPNTERSASLQNPPNGNVNFGSGNSTIPLSQTMQMSFAQQVMSVFSGFFTMLHRASNPQPSSQYGYNFNPQAPVEEKPWTPPLLQPGATQRNTLPPGCPFPTATNNATGYSVQVPGLNQQSGIPGHLRLEPKG